MQEQAYNVRYFIGTSRRKGDVNIRDILEKHKLPHLLEEILIASYDILLSNA